MLADYKHPLGSERSTPWDHWELLETGSRFARYIVRHATEARSAEMFLIHALPLAGRKALERQLRLLSMLAIPEVRKCLEHDFSKLPAQLILDTRAPESLHEKLSGESSLDWLSIAERLIRITADAQRIGLLSGDLSPTAIRVFEEGRLQLDFVSRLLTLDESTSEFEQDGDWKGLQESLHVILSRVLNQDRCIESPKLGPRDRAALKHLLKEQAGTEPPEAFEWLLLFQSLGLCAEPRSIEPPDLNEGPDRTHEATPIMGAAFAPRPVKPYRDSAQETSGTHVLESRMDATAVAECESQAISDHQKLEPLQIGDLLGRYRIDAFVGKGGMGAVYRATDMASQETVALKVLRTDSRDIAQAVRRFRKEARLLGQVQNEYVTRLYEVGHDREHHFIAMEFIEGISLKDWLSEHGPLSESDSLKLMADITRALVDAHDRKIVHRDIKPENILLQFVNGPIRKDGVGTSKDLNSYRVKLSDFGIARQVHQSGSLEVTQAGTMLGTPLYMAPEQFKGTATIEPATDIYALGVTWFQLLIGKTPFNGNDPMKLAAMHCFDAPPSLQKLDARISDTVAQVVARMLAKSHEDRFADAGQLLREIERLTRGDPADIASHPRLPQPMAMPVWERKFHWDLCSSPAQLWPFVSNTERLNRAIGLPSVKYRTEQQPGGGVRKFGEFKLGAVRVAWEEHPFEWIEGSRMGILREFTTGPFAWFMSAVELQRREDGGTRLVHHIRIQPRNRLGTFLATVEADWKGHKQLDRVYRRIDQSIQGQLTAQQGTDPFESPAKISRVQRRRIEDRIERVVRSGVDPDLAARLTEFLATAAPQTLAQIRPLVLADQWKVPGDQVVDICLVAAAEGLLILRWDILCPTCRAPAATREILKEIQQHTHCEACSVDFRSNLGDAIELVFRAHPEIRAVDDASYCIGGPEHSPHVVAQVRLAPQERMELDVALQSGDYLIRGPRTTRKQMLKVRSTGAPHQFDGRISALGESNNTPVLRAGRQTITLNNDTEHEQLIRIERWITREQVITATAAASISRFRTLFPEQKLEANVAIASEELTLLATGIPQVDRLYQELGDSEAYTVLQRHLALLTECVQSHGGSVAKTVGEGMLAVFNDCGRAVAAAFQMQEIVASSRSLHGLPFAIGVHRGKTLVSTQNDRLDYFGGAARAVMAIPALMDRGVVLTERIFADPEIQEQFKQELARASVERMDLPGAPGLYVQRIERIS